MPNPEHISIARKGASEILAWRRTPGNVRLDLSDADLTGVDLRGADLSGADLHGSDLSRARLNSANLYLVNASLAKFHSADLRLAQIRGARLTGCDLTGALLIGATLRTVDLGPAKLRGPASAEQSFLPLTSVRLVASTPRSTTGTIPLASTRSSSHAAAFIPTSCVPAECRKRSSRSC